MLQSGNRVVFVLALGPIYRLIGGTEYGKMGGGCNAYVELHGELGAIMEMVDENERRPAGISARRSLSVVAGVRHYRKRTVVVLYV